jgi:hypothetical protein
MCVVGTPSFRALGPRLVLTFRVPPLVPLEDIPLSTTNNPIQPPILQETSGLYLGVNDRYVRLIGHSLVLSKFGVLVCKDKTRRGLFWQSCGFPLPPVLWTCWGWYIVRCSAINTTEFEAVIWLSNVCAFTRTVHFVTVVRFDVFSEATDVPRERVFREIWKVVFKRRVVLLPRCLYCVTTKPKKHKQSGIVLYSWDRASWDIKVVYMTNKMLQNSQYFIVINALHVSGHHCPSSGARNCMCNHTVCELWGALFGRLYCSHGVMVVVESLCVEACGSEDQVKRCNSYGCVVEFCRCVWYLRVRWIQHCADC